MVPLQIGDNVQTIHFAAKPTVSTFGYRQYINREKGIVIDANSNEKRLKEEKSELIEIDSKYYDTEKKSNEDLDNSKNKLNYVYILTPKGIKQKTAITKKFIIKKKQEYDKLNSYLNK